MHMHAANNNGIKILGAIILRFTGRSPSGQTLETRQIVYVTSDADKLFLSREACRALRMISENFPTVGETLNLSKTMALDEDPVESQQTTLSAIPESALNSPCNCPRRQTPPQKPTQLPFPATEANRQRLQTWLLNYYKSSTFNTCEHQHLPLMAGVHMTLMVDAKAEPVALDAKAEPVAHHTPIPVPLSGLEIATDTVATDTFFLLATRTVRLVANLRFGFALTDKK